MKKILALILALVLCFGLCACGSSNADPNGTTNKPDDATQKYVGEWKANVIGISLGSVTIYKVAVIMLNADGTATYKGKAATWELKDDTIHLAVTSGGIGVLGIAEEDGKTVLKFSEYTYYRASEFKEIDNVPALIEGKTELIVGNPYTTANGMVFTLEKAELITEGIDCHFALSIASDEDFDIGASQYTAANNIAGFSMLHESRDGNVTYFLSGSSFDKAKLEADAEAFGILSFTIDGTDYYVSIDAFFQ